MSTEPRDEGIKIGQEKGIKIGEEKGRVEGREEGRKVEKIEVAKNLLKARVSIDIIAQTTGLSQDEIIQLKEEVASLSNR